MLMLNSLHVLFPSRNVAQRRDHLAEREERFVDLTCLFAHFAGALGLLQTLRARQVDKGELAQKRARVPVRGINQLALCRLNLQDLRSSGISQRMKRYRHEG